MDEAAGMDGLGGGGREWGNGGGMFNEFNEGGFRRSRRVPSCLGGFAYSVCHAGDPFLFLPATPCIFTTNNWNRQVQQLSTAASTRSLVPRSNG